MAKRKRRSKRKEEKKSRQPEKHQKRDSQTPSEEHFPANPPKPNVVLLVTSGVLAIGWLIYLLIVAING